MRFAAMGPLDTCEQHRTDLDRITRTVIGCTHRVSNTLGVGFLEKVYENALAIELRSAGLKCGIGKLSLGILSLTLW